MPRYIFAYHGGSAPESPEEGEKIIQKWQAWIESNGAAMIDPGNPVGISKTVSADGVADNGGVNPLMGYSIVESATIDDAVEIAKSCPHVEEGSVEVAEIHEL